MSIGVQCEKCGRRYRVLEDREGTQMTCACGTSVLVAGPRYEDKLCVACGIDVTHLTRTRDASGNYYCQPCWDEALRLARQQAEQEKDYEMGWLTAQLERFQLRRIATPMIILATLALLAVGYIQPRIAVVMGATLMVLGGMLLVACTIWLYVVPFRDGFDVGFACMVKRARRIAWAERNPEFNLRRPASLVLAGFIMMLVAACFFLIAEVGRSAAAV
jgi:hypothetical protein